MTNPFTNPKQIWILCGTIASVGFMLTMLFGMADEVRSNNATSAADAVVQAEKKEEGGYFGNFLTGTVTINGKAKMPFGFIRVYHSSSGKWVGKGSIEPGGVYNVSNLPVGDVILIVTVKQPNFQKKPSYHPASRRVQPRATKPDANLTPPSCRSFSVPPIPRITRSPITMAMKISPATCPIASCCNRASL